MDLILFPYTGSNKVQTHNKKQQEQQEQMDLLTSFGDKMEM